MANGGSPHGHEPEKVKKAPVPKRTGPAPTKATKKAAPAQPTKKKGS